MNMPLVWSALALLFILLLTPAIMFLCIGWERRRKHILDGFSDEAITSYFQAFHPQAKDQSTDVHERINAYYNREIGRQRYIWPLLLLVCLAGLVFYWSGPTLSDLLQYESVDSGKLPGLALAAFLGAYMWVLFDAIARWYASNLTPVDIYWWCFRLTISIPMGYAVKDVFAESFAPLIVFLLGAFPTTQLMAMARRIASQKLNIKEDDEKEVSELQELQGVDMRKAERFVAEDVTTILQLAYADPIRTTIRTGFSYSYVVDCTCQALLWIYVQKEIAALRKSGLRSAYEVLDLWLDLHHPDEQADAKLLITQIAQDLGRPECCVCNILEQVACDPYTQFLFLSWSGYSRNDIHESGRPFFGFSDP